MDTYTVIILHAHDGQSPDGRLTDSLQIEVITDDVKEAIKIAEGYNKKLPKDQQKKFIRVGQIIQRFKE
jgi:hypothetical protein